jgi:hypothetical protein
MLYRPIETAEPAPALPSRRSHIWTALAGIFASISKRSADTRYLDGMRPEELEDLGLRRTESRGYDFLR